MPADRGMNSDRRRLLAIAGAAVGLTGCTQEPDDGTPAGTPTTGETPTSDETETPTDDETPTDEPVPGTVDLETLAGGLRAPVAVAFPPDADLRYVATQPGKVLAHGPDGLRDEPLLDLSDRVDFGGEKGLLGVALHPEFGDEGRLFVRYSTPPREGTPPGYSHTFVLAEFRVDDGTRVDPDSERTVLEIPQPQGNHNAGDLAFGPDGYLYVPTGDGGGAGDTGRGHPDDWYDANRGGNGQDTTENLLGGILRLDVDSEPTEHYRTDDDAPGSPDGETGYAVPQDNPLVDEPGHRDEYYAWGLRNPWRASFDDGTLYVGDVGQTGWEEVNVVERGGNYGWNVREGSGCYRAGACPDETPPDVRGGEPLVGPVLEYPNETPSAGEIDGVAIIGGHVYRGSAIPGFAGRYVFGDLRPNGRLFVGRPPGDGGDGWSAELVDLADEAAEDLGRLLGFGRDGGGEVYALGGAGLHRVVPAA